MNLPSKKKGFTLIELLVVISIIGILASLAIPAVGGALTRGQMTQTLNNVRQLHLATTTMDMDNTAAGVGGGFPGALANDNLRNFDDWTSELRVGKYLSEGDLRKLLSAERVAVDEALSSGTAALFLYDTTVTDTLEEGESDNQLPFLSTKNWDGTSPSTAPETTAQPYGDKGIVVMRKGGEGSILQPRLLTNRNVAGPSASAKME